MNQLNLFLIKYNFKIPYKEAKINFAFTELSPLVLFTKMVSVSSMLKELFFKTIIISDKIIKPSPMFPHFFVIISVALFE